MTEITLLVVSPGLLGTQQLESRTEIDSSPYTFVVTNVTTSLVTLTNIKLYLKFDFTNDNLTINGYSTSTPDDPLTIEVDDLIPGEFQTITVNIVANVGENPTPANPYTFEILATYDVQPVIEPINLSGGIQVFSVVPD